MTLQHTAELHRLEHTFLYSIGPDRNGFDTEPLSAYFTRISPLLPNVPFEVVQEWLHRHYPFGVSDYDWIGIRRLTFRKERWTSEQILENVKLYQSDDLVAKHERLFSENSEYLQRWVADTVREYGTWATPPIVIENSIELQLPSGIRLGEPYHLMEGHHRLGYLRALEAKERAALHEVWIAVPDPDAIMAFHPMNDLRGCCDTAAEQPPP